MTDLRSDWQKRQAALCSCKGTDDYCPCQNVDFTTPQPTQPSIGMDEREKIARDIMAEEAQANGYPRSAASIRKGDDPWFNTVMVRAMHRFAALSATPVDVGEVVEVLAPFAKAGSLIRDDTLSDFWVYRPAAGDEYGIGGVDLRRARALHDRLTGKDR